MNPGEQSQNVKQMVNICCCFAVRINTTGSTMTVTANARLAAATTTRPSDDGDPTAAEAATTGTPGHVTTATTADPVTEALAREETAGAVTATARSPGPRDRVNRSV